MSSNASKGLVGSIVEVANKIWSTKTGYVSRPDYRVSPGTGATGGVVPRQPVEFRHDIKYFNRDTRRAPVPTNVVTPENPENKTNFFESPIATNLVHNNAALSPELRNLSLAAHTPIPTWLYQADAIDAEYKALDVPPPFGKYQNLKKDPNGHLKPKFVSHINN